MVFRIFLLSLFLFIVELYAFQAIKTLIKLKWLLVAYQVVSAIALLYIVYSFTQFDRSIGQTRQTMITMALFLIIYTPKLILTLFMLGEDIFRVGSGSTRFFMQSENFEFLNSRRKFVSQIGLWLILYLYQQIHHWYYLRTRLETLV